MLAITASDKRTVVRLPGIRTAVLGITLVAASALTAGCAVTATASAPSAARFTAGAAASGLFCADEFTAPTGAQESALDRYWTPQALRALRPVSRGKMLVMVPRRHLPWPLQLALRRAEWAQRTFTPKPRRECGPLRQLQIRRGAATGPVPAKTQP